MSLINSTLSFFLFFFFNDTATTEIYTLSLHDALPISAGYTATFLPHPAAIGTPAGAITPEYDAARQALLVAVARNSQPQLPRFALGRGSRSSPPTQIAGAGLQPVGLSHDRVQILALRS